MEGTKIQVLSHGNLLVIREATAGPKFRPASLSRVDLSSLEQP